MAANPVPSGVTVDGTSYAKHSDFIAAMKSNLRSGSFVDAPGDGLRQILQVGREATRMTDRWEVQRASSREDANFTILILNLSALRLINSWRSPAWF